ncbi:MAG: hypothetical protein H0W15_07305 [Gemmatimonadales bacterium]|nr:hypothetical protein [Gemmatimonadales bacterium]
MAESPVTPPAADPPPLDLDHPTPRQRRSLRFRVFRALVIALATFGGAIIGFVVTLAIIVAEAQVGRFIFALEDILAFRWEVLPVPLFAVAAFQLARQRPGTMAWATVSGFGGMVLGAVIGAGVGSVVLAEGVGPWAGGVIGAAAGLVTGSIAALRIRHVPKEPIIAAGAGLIGLVAAAGFAVFGATNLLHVTPLDFGEVGGVPLPAPADVDAAVFLLGDAGAAEAGTSPLLDALGADVERWSAGLRRDSAVAVVYLGDIVYPVGVRDRDHPAFVVDSTRLRSQVDLVAGPEALKHNTVGLFLTGNHDWGNAVGDVGIKRVRNLQEQLLAARETGPLVALIPNAGDPGPIVRDLRRNVRVIFIDTHWFLQERSEAMHDQFFGRLRNAIDGARDREVIIVAHHPYFSAGPHGAVVPGYYSGGLDYILKRTGALVQDLNSPAYEGLLGKLRLAFAASERPPLVYAGGHDHSLQVLTGAADFDPRFNLVSGAGSKVSAIAMGPGLVWGGEQPGYMMLVFRKDDGVDLFVVGGDRQHLTCIGTDDEIRKCRTEGVNAFEIMYSASLLGPSKRPRELTPVIPDSLLLPDSLAPGTPWWTAEGPVGGPIAAEKDEETLRPAPVAVSTRVLLHSRDSAMTTFGKSYRAGPVRRLIAGELNRELWNTPVKLPILDLDSVGSGLHPLKIIGGKQTVGLRFAGRDGLEYEFRPIVKNPSKVLPAPLRNGLAFAVLDDQMAAQFPFGAVVVGELLEAAGISAPKPVAVVMPNDQRLGKYRAMFAGRVGILALNANEREDDRPGFGGYSKIIGGESLADKLRDDPSATVDPSRYLRSRLVDLLVGDWDRHAGQWRWGRQMKNGVTEWDAIPEDRDWAFVRIDGLVGVISRALLPRYAGFSATFPPIHRLAETAAPLDRLVMSGLDRGAFVSEARRLQGILTDSLITAAVSTLPPPFVDQQGDRLINGLRSRRDDLVRYSEDYYEYVMRTIEVRTHAGVDNVVTFERSGIRRVRVTLREGGEKGTIRFQRDIDPALTRNVVIHLDPARDRVVGNRNLPLTVKLVDVNKKRDRPEEEVALR